MKHNNKVVSLFTALSASLLFAQGACAAVSAEQAATLKTTLTRSVASAPATPTAASRPGTAVTPRPIRLTKRAASAATRSPATSRC